MDLIRFWSNVAKTDDAGSCWEWTGRLTHYGYGCFREFLGKTPKRKNRYRYIKAHRIAWTLAHGDIEPSVFVCHKCDNPKCVRLDHLFVGTNADNMRDKAAKGRAPRGESNGAGAKLTTAAVVEIRRRRACGQQLKTLAEEFRVSPRTISNVANRRKWAHVA